MDEKFRDRISGITEKVIYHDSSTGACKIIIKTSNTHNQIKLTGYISEIALGQYVVASGQWIKRKHILEFEATNLKTSLPNKLEDIENYLSSGHFFGIGQHNAKILTKEFGDKIFKIIEHQPEALTKIPGIGKLKAKRMYEHLHKQKKMHDILLFLEYYGISINNAIMIYNTYGADSLNIIREDPFKLFSLGIISFDKADYIAHDLKMPKDSKSRILAAINFIIANYPTEKQLYAHILSQEVTRLLGDISQKKIDEIVSDLIKSNLISVN